MNAKKIFKNPKIAVIPGDGIGKEVMPEGVRALEAANRKFNIGMQFDHFDFASCDYYLKHGKMMPFIMGDLSKKLGRRLRKLRA